MKIGILSLPVFPNYGGLLQAYALQTILEKEGHNVTIIDQNPTKGKKPSHLNIILKIIVRIIKKFIFHKPVYILYEQKMKEFDIYGYKNLSYFMNNKLHRKFYKNLLDIKKDEYDAYIVGSDQVWRPKYFPYIPNAFLEFAKTFDVKRIAYAASFGCDTWELSDKETEVCSNLIKKFDLITVREQSGIKLCKTYFDIDAKLVLDPTLLAPKEIYNNLILENKVQSGLFYYIFDKSNDKLELINRIAKEKNIDPFQVDMNRINDNRIKPEDRSQKDIGTWLSAIKNSGFIVTDSFHASVFSIIFKKPFISFGNKDRGATRIKSLLETLKLESNYIDDIKKYDSNYNYAPKIETYNIIETLQKESMKLLLNSLK